MISKTQGRHTAALLKEELWPGRPPPAPRGFDGPWLSEAAPTEIQRNDGISCGGCELRQLLGLLLQLGEQEVALLRRSHLAAVVKDAIHGHQVRLERGLRLVHGEHHVVLLNLTGGTRASFRPSTVSSKTLLLSRHMEVLIAKPLTQKHGYGQCAGIP